MLNNELIKPTSLLIVGGLDSVFKTGGKALKNIIDTGYQ